MFTEPDKFFFVSLSLLFSSNLFSSHSSFCFAYMMNPRPLPVLVTGGLVITKLKVRLTCNFQVGDSNLVQGELINDMM